MSTLRKGDPMRKLLRAGVLAVALLGLLGSTLSPAQATTAFTFTFEGSARTGPLGYPCAPIPSGIFSNCPEPVGTGGNTVGFTFASNTCVGSKTDVLKAKNPPGEPVKTYTGLCSITASGVVTGYCGLSTGGGSGTIVFTDAVKGNAKVMPFTFTWTGSAHTLVVTGTSNKGPFFGTAEAL
ncbi:MAG TPA: hypothetical protein VGB03_07550, partial [Acidimicrobiales bacterium]